jgi:hypothetical protein
VNGKGLIVMPWWAWLMAVIAGTIGVGWAIAKAYATHEWKTCQCVDCRKRRYHAHKAKGHVATGVTSDGDLIWAEAPSESVAPASKARWMSTAELSPRDVIVLRDVPYLVMDIRTDSRGYLVQIQALTGKDRRRPILVSVAWANGNKKYWEPR